MWDFIWWMLLFFRSWGFLCRVVRIFSHPNVLPVVGCCNSPPNLVVITQYLPYGSLYRVLHQDQGDIVLDTMQALKWALDITKGMAFIHSLNKVVPNLYLSSKHVMVSTPSLFTFRVTVMFWSCCEFNTMHFRSTWIEKRNCSFLFTFVSDWWRFHCKD